MYDECLFLNDLFLYHELRYSKSKSVLRVEQSIENILLLIFLYFNVFDNERFGSENNELLTEIL